VVTVGNKYYLRPLRITFDLMKEAAVHAFNMYAESNWTKENLKQYLSRYCLAIDMINDVYSNAVCCKRLNKTRAKAGSDENSELTKLLEVQKDYPLLFRVPIFPVAWNNKQQDLTIAHSETPPMHLLFLGHCKDCNKLLFKFLKSRQLDSKFRGLFTKSGFLNIIGSWNLDWCPAMNFGNGSFGGFISENYVAAARLLSWFMVVIHEICHDDAFDNKRPNGEKMSNKQLRQWLTHCGCKTTKEQTRKILLISFYQIMEDIAENPVVNNLSTCSVVQMNTVLH